MVVAKFPSDALELIEKGADPKEVVVGNQAILPGTKPKNITRSIAVTEDQAPIYRAIAEKGYQLHAKVMPQIRGWISSRPWKNMASKGMEAGSFEVDITPRFP